MSGLRGTWVVPAAALLLAGCGEDGLVTPSGPVGGEALASITCEVDLRSGALSCAGEEAGLEGGVLGAIIGGQGVYVQLASSNVGYDSGTEVFSADVTVQNLGNQVLGSSDGSTPDAAGVRIFFVRDPVTVEGSGEVTVHNPDGHADFSGASQPYFEYSQALAPGRVSLPRSWHWHVPGTVQRFSFEVGVGAALPDENALVPGAKIIASTITADSAHNCAIDMAGQAYCWGRGGTYRLGNNDNTNQLSPVQVVQEGRRFVSIHAGNSHTCALDDTGDAYCWGNGGSGRLGNGSTTTSRLPVPVSGGHKFMQLATGRLYNCGLTTAGDAYCWGSNVWGQLGDGTDENRSEPVAVLGGLKFSWIAAGWFHTCGVTTDGDTYCWGAQNNGKLGNGDPESGMVTEPTKILGDHRFVKVYAATQHTCGLTAEGEAWCWGSNLWGRIGDGTEDNTLEPVRVAGGHRFVDLSLNLYHSCGITIEGKAYCWGSQNKGKIGNGLTAGSTAVTEPAQVVDIDGFVQIVNGGDHSCAVTAAGRVYCWGSGNVGQLGNGGTANSGRPVEVQIPTNVAVLDRLVEPFAAPGAELFPRAPLMERLVLAASAAGTAFGPV